MSAKIAFIAFFLLITGSLATYDPFMDYVRRNDLHRSIYDTQTDALDFVEGFLEGVGSADVFAEIKQCITDGESFISDVSNGIEDIMTKNAAQVKTGVQLLGQACQIVPNAIKDCKGGEDELKNILKFVKTFQNPLSFLYYVGKSLIINHVDVLNEVSQAITAYQGKNYNQLGYWVGKAMDTIIIGNPEEVQDIKTNLLNFAEGFLNGIETADLFVQIESCLGESEDFVTDVEAAIADIRSKDPARVKNGIYELGEAAQLIPVAAQACKAADADVENLIKLAKTFTSPASFLYYIGKSLLINHVEVINEVDNAVTSYDASNYTQLGFWTGKAMDTVLFGGSDNVQDIKTNLLNFAEGFLNGIETADLFVQIESCLNSEEDFVTDVEAAIADIRSKDPARVKNGIYELGEAAQLIPVAAQACKAADADVENLIKLAKTFTSPASFLYYIGKSLLINHVEVINEVDNAVTSYDASNYTQLGFWTGKAMDTVLFGGSDNVQDIKTNLLNFAEGFLNGIETADLFVQIESCLNSEEDFITDVEAAIADIRSKDPARVKNGIYELGEAAQLIPVAAQACKAADADVENLIKLAKTFTSPASFLYYIGKSLLINHVEVINEVDNAVTSYDASNYTQLGFWTGKAMDTVLFGGSDDVKDTKTDILNFVEGLLEGIGSAQAFDQVRACVADSEDIISDITCAVGDLTSKDPAKVKLGIQLIGQVAQIIPDAAQECKAGYVDLKTLIKMVNAFKSPLSFLYYVGKSLLINHVEVINEVESAITGYQADNYTALGYWIGAAMDTVILGDDQVLNQDFADYLNKKNEWQAGLPSKFEGMTFAEIKGRFLGANLDKTRFENVTVYNYEGAVNDIPASFNASEQWPGCVHAIRDQGQCGSCWAFAASEVLSDRLCIASNGSVNVVLSPQYLVSCNDILNHGCNGGNLLFSWWFMDSDGMVTDSCLPYESYNGTNPLKCKDFTTCQDGTPLKKYYGKAPASLPNPESIQVNLMNYGPVEAGMTVYQDFMYYQGGIYKHTSGSELGGHAVKIIGWGNENGENFWIVANSWGPTWGESGFFRIAFGQCGIDTGCVSGQADLTKTMMSENRFW